jgi:hypothetical protein
MTAATQSPENTALARVGLRLSDWFEKWFPDAFVLALSVVAIVFVASVAASIAGGDSFFADAIGGVLDSVASRSAAITGKDVAAPA